MLAGRPQEEELKRFKASDGLTLNRSIENSSVIAGRKVTYVGVLSRWVDMMVRVYRSPIDCSNFLTEIESKAFS